MVFSDSFGVLVGFGVFFGDFEKWGKRIGFFRSFWGVSVTFGGVLGWFLSSFSERVFGGFIGCYLSAKMGKIAGLGAQI